MARKDKPQRRIDQRVGALSGSNFLIEDFDAAPELEIGTADIVAPENLTVAGTTLAYSAYTPTATVALTWDTMYDRQIDGFVVEWALDSIFTDPVARIIAGNVSEAAIDGLPTDVTVYFRVAARFSYSQSDWSTSVSTTTAVDATAPDAPTSLLSNWSSITGDLTIAWTNPTSRNAAYVRLRIYDSNGGTLLREIQSVAGRYVWTRAQQESDTSGAYDPSVYVVLTTISTSGTASATDLTGTLTAPTPSAVTATATGAFTAFTITATPTSADLLADYRFRIYRDSVLTATIYSPSNILTYTAVDSGSYQCDVTARDAILQLGTPSALTTAVTLQSETEFVAQLRSGLYYTDSLGTAQATLNQLKDGTTSSGGPTYAGGTWVWIQGDWNTEVRHSVTTVALSATSSAYFSTAPTDATRTYYYGGTVSGGVWTPTSTTSTEATAQAGAVALPSGVTLIKLSATVTAQTFRLHLDDAITVHEFYPRRLVEADDIVVQNLSAINADLGSITAGTVTGATIRTAASGQRVELTSASGLVGYNSSNVAQVTISASTGELTSGAATLNSKGITIKPDSDLATRSLKWQNSAGTQTYANMTATQTSIGGVNSNDLTISTPEPSGGGESTITFSVGFNTTSDSVTIGPNQTTFDTDLVYMIQDLQVDGATVTLQPGAITREAWIVPGTFTNGWTGTNFAYYKSADNIVRFRGRLNAGTLNANVFQLAATYRPATQSEYLVLGVNTLGATTFCRLFVGTGGFIQIETNSAGTLDFVDCSAVSFRVD
jgi:hypothetical protein